LKNTLSKKKPIQIWEGHLGHYKADGMAWVDDRVISIDKRLKGLNRLETIIHEIIHVQNPKWPEIMVEGKAKEMATIIWELGYRHCDL
jgi:hypothetical protein